MNFVKTKVIFGVPITSVRLNEIVLIIAKMIESPGKKTLFGLNLHNLNLSFSDKEYKTVLKNANMVYPEGFGILLVSKIKKKLLLEKTTLMDFIYDLLKIAEEKKWRIYLFGGKEGVTQKAVNNLKQKYPRLIIKGNYSGYLNKKEEKSLIGEINSFRPKILFVAMGSPVQEKWIAKNVKNLSAKVLLGIGGSIDILSGNLPRAPKWMGKLGLEWLFRLIREPKRLWKRYLLQDLPFLCKVVFSSLI